MHGIAHIMAKLYFYYASMNAGKSTTLLQADFNYRERGMETMLWTAALDDRYGAGQVTSRIGLIAPYGAGFCDSCNRLRVTGPGVIAAAMAGRQQKRVRLVTAGRT